MKTNRNPQQTYLQLPPFSVVFLLFFLVSLLSPILTNSPPSFLAAWNLLSFLAVCMDCISLFQWCGFSLRSLYHSFLYFVSLLSFSFFLFSVLPSLSFVQDAFVEILPEIPRLLFWKVLLPNHACGLSFISWLWRISKEIGKSDQNQRMGMGIWGCGCAWRFSMHHSSLFQ